MNSDGKKTEQSGLMLSYLFDRSIDVNERLSMLFIGSGIFWGLLGVLICVAANVPLLGTLVTLSMPIFAFILLCVGYFFDCVSIVRKIVCILVMIIMPVMWITTGASSGGGVIWFIYEMFFITITQEKRKPGILFVFGFALQLLFIYLDSVYYQYIFHFVTIRDRYVSIVGSAVLVSVAIVAMIMVMLRIYDYERGLSDDRANRMVEINRELNLANASQMIFLANMSHEIRTPINGIVGMNEMILRESSDPEIIQYAMNVEDSSHHLLNIVNDILDFSKIESGKFELVSYDFRFSRMINDVKNMVRVKAEDKGLEFELSVDENIPELVYGDETRIKQIFINILSNAVKYTDEGKISFRLFSEKMSDNKVYICFDVSDTGRGIREGDKDAIFDAFSRSDVKQNKKIEGTGLGLTITKSLTEAMGGYIDFDSTYGYGSRFYGRFVLGVNGTDVVGDIEKTINTTVKERKQYKESFTAPDAKILAIDDTKMNLTLLKNLLKKTLVNITTASSGASGVEMLRREKFDLVLLDHMMPEMDGIEAFSIMKSEDLVGDMPVIMLTANAVSGTREKYMEEGFTDYLSKPIDFVELEEALIKYLPKEKVNITKLETRSEIMGN